LKPARERGFVLALTILMVLGVTAISVGIMFNGRMGRMSAINYKTKIKSFMASDGMVTLLAQELINGNGYKYVDATRMGRIRGKIWKGTAGNSVANFEILAGTTPYSDTISSPYLGSNLNDANYGIKWTGWIIPPLTGAYTFITRSDDDMPDRARLDRRLAGLGTVRFGRHAPGGGPPVLLRVLPQARRGMGRGPGRLERS
jgi:hypothetical protein